MKSSGNAFNDFPEIVPTREITAKIEKTFLPWAWAYFLNGPNAAASIAPTLHWPYRMRSVGGVLISFP